MFKGHLDFRLFTHMLWEYRNDKWWKLTVDLLRKALNCAYLSASLQEYVERCMEAAYLFCDEEKFRVIANVNSIIQVKIWEVVSQSPPRIL